MFRSYLRVALRSELDIRARGTVQGMVIRAVDDALGEEPDQFCNEAGHWRLGGDERDAGWSEGLARLIEAAWTVETTTVHFSRYAEKTPRWAAGATTGRRVPNETKSSARYRPHVPDGSHFRASEAFLVIRWDGPLSRGPPITGYGAVIGRASENPTGGRPGR